MKKIYEILAVACILSIILPVTAIAEASDSDDVVDYEENELGIESTESLNEKDPVMLYDSSNCVSYKAGKMSIVDIKAEDENGVWYDIEMQLAEQVFYEKRAFYYWAKVYSDQLESGYNYDKLRKTISINILDFDYLDEEEFHNEYRIYNKESKKELSSVFEMHFIELNKFNKDFKEVKTALDRWAVFLNRAYELEKDRMPEQQHLYLPLTDSVQIYR